MARPKLLLDLTPLRRSRDFRILFGAQMVSTLGTQLTLVAVPYQVYLLTRSSLDVGLVSLAQLLPLLFCSLIGGAVADAHDRRRLLLVVELLQAAASVGLAINGGLAHPSLWPMFAFTAMAGGLAGFDRPAYNASIPLLVERPFLSAAYALWQVQIQVGAVAGPAVAGLLLSGAGVSTVYWLDVASYGVAFAGAMALRPIPPAAGSRPAGLRSVVEGLAFLRGRPSIQGIYLLDINAMVFGMPRALFPALGVGVFHGGAQAVGFLYAGPGVGALIGALTTGWVAGVRRQGWAVIVSVAIWGAAIAAFGAVPWLAVAIALLAVAGWADVISAVFRNTILQSSVPDRLRGRLSALQIAVVQGGPRLGDLEAGAVADGLGTAVSVISGGLACVAGALVLAAVLPGFRRYDAATVTVEA
ncbi:MAG: MFS transporter [Acidimicrobiales bacterium]